MPAVSELRAVLGNRVRYGIDLTAKTEHALVSAVWTCGCRAYGKNFDAMRVQPCEAHVGRFTDT